MKVLLRVVLLLPMLLSLALFPLPAAASVIEVLELDVPAQARDAWFQAEEATWTPWLQTQDGFEGKELFWDGERERVIALVHWASRDQWHAISDAAMEPVEQRFRQLARQELTRLGLEDLVAKEHPFPIVASYEFDPLAPHDPAQLP